MQTEQLRSLLLEYLKQWHTHSSRPSNVRNDLTYDKCVNGVQSLAAQKYPAELAQVEAARYRLHEQDQVRLKHVVWDLILERVLVPSTNMTQVISNDGWPNLSFTDHGATVIQAVGPIPYDPDSYLERLDSSPAGPIHSTARTYLAESISSFRTGNRLAALVMLGAASEWVFFEVRDAISQAIKDPAKKKRFDDNTGPKKKLNEVIESVTHWLNNNRKSLHADWQTAEQISLVANVGALIRYRRNDVGHPNETPPSVRHEEVFDLLAIFHRQCIKLYELKKWLLAHKASI